MQCKLCLQEKQLIRKSHIIPRQFFHKASDCIRKGFGTQENQHKTQGRILSKKRKPVQAQSGIHVSNILCKDCEQKLGIFDNYVQTILLNKEANIIKTSQIWRIENVDYEKTKLFFISVLWRSHICDNYFFDEVNLPSHLEAELRDIINKNNPDIENKFQIILLRYPGIEANIFSVKKWVQPCESYYFRLGNYTFIIKVDENDFPNNFKNYILKPGQDLLIPVFADYKETTEYQILLENIDQYKGCDSIKEKIKKCSLE